MASPDYQFLEYDPEETPDARLEVMGRGSQNRKSKTLLPNIELAVVLGLSKEHITHLTELFRSLHAKTFKVLEVTEDGDGNKTEAWVPEVLTDAQLRETYSCIRKWESFHQEQVDHYPSVGGFSTKAALGYDEKREKTDRRESSAGTDRNPRWD